MKRPFKIALVSPYDYAHHGGVTDHIRKLSIQFNQMDHDVRIIAPCSDINKISDDNFIPMGKPVPIPSGGSVARVSLSVWLRPRIKSMLKKEAFDIIHLHEPFAGSINLNVLGVVESLNSINVGTFHTNGGTKLYGIGGVRIAKRYFRRLHGRIAVSDTAFRFINSHFPSEYRIIPNGIQVDDFAEAMPFPNLLDGMINLLFVGRLEKRKGLKYLLSAYSKLKWNWPNLRLLVLGSGNPDADSYRIIGERKLDDVVFLGSVSDKDKARYYKSSHIYCSPAIGKESFGIVLLEAMAAGIPVVASDIEGYSSVIKHGHEGLLVAPKSDDELAEAISTLIKNSNLRVSMGKHGRLSAQSFRWESVAKQVMEYYNELHEKHTIINQV